MAHTTVSFSMNVDSGNDIFQSDPTTELVRILRETADKIDAGNYFSYFGQIKDIQGNSIGQFALHIETDYESDLDG